ncbi:Iron-sulfur assembly protein 1 [Cladochytrium tenue]|nr:Iron-sulfur assembly protein 1 [Cladochytrium tenue]
MAASSHCWDTVRAPVAIPAATAAIVAAAPRALCIRCNRRSGDRRCHGPEGRAATYGSEGGSNAGMVSTRKKGCSGQSYTLEYVTAPSRLDEVIEQDGVRVVVDSKALFSLIGSEMDYVEDLLSSQFVFNNPNVKPIEICPPDQNHVG